MKILIGLFLFLAFSTACFGQQTKAKPSAETFSATSLDGKIIDLAQLRGKVVLISFWSTKCAICHSEIPKLNRLVQTYKNRNVVFLALTMENSNKVEAYLKKWAFDFNIVPNSFGVVLKYADKTNDGNISMGFPAHFLINQKGEIELKTNGFDKTAEIDSKINQLLNSN